MALPDDVLATVASPMCAHRRSPLQEAAATDCGSKRGGPSEEAIARPHSIDRAGRCGDQDSKLVARLHRTEGLFGCIAVVLRPGTKGTRGTNSGRRGQATCALPDGSSEARSSWSASQLRAVARRVENSTRLANLHPRPARNAATLQVAPSSSRRRLHDPNLLACLSSSMPWRGHVSDDQSRGSLGHQH